MKKIILLLTMLALACGSAFAQFEENDTIASAGYYDEDTLMIDSVAEEDPVMVEKGAKAIAAFIAEDYENAVPLLKECAEAGMPGKQYLLGYCYENGLGVTKSPKDAARWYEAAAWQGYPAAEFRFAMCLTLGVGVEKDFDRAMEWLISAARDGDVDATRILDKNNIEY